MAYPAGTRLGPYVIQTLIGSGGMGHVYRAHDARLDRDVAIKVLPDSVATDPDRIARFEREAKALAALNHPNIAHLYGLEESNGVTALVMEHVPGQTLEQLISGGLPVAEALNVARQIADALEAAHEKGIIHRDLKPGNVKLTPDGVAKVLDFGLAKALDPHGSTLPGSATDSPTLTARATQMGVILGTAAYMAPEQARGKAVDKRADIWAFGVVLYEMLTGRRAFDGDDMTAVLARVIERDPDWAQLPAATPPALRHVLERCLTKDPKARLRDIGEARHTLDELAAGRSGLFTALTTSTVEASVRDSGAHAGPPRGASRMGSLLPWAVAAALAIVAAMAWLRPATGATTTPRPVRVEITLPEGVEFYGSARLSPDGRRVIFIGNREGNRQMYLRELDKAGARALAGTDGSIYLAFGPDSQSAAIVTTDARLKRIDLTTGTVEDLTTGVDIVSGVCWTTDGRLLYGKGTKLLSIPAVGGASKELVSVPSDVAETLVAPIATPDNKTMLFTTWTGPAGAQRPRIDAVPIDGGERRAVLDNAGYVFAAFPDRILFQRELSLYSAPFDAARAVVTGVATKLLDEARVSPIGGLAVDVTASGDLLFADVRTYSGGLSWVSLDGVDRPIAVAQRGYNNPRVSPDGRTVAYSDASAIWTTDTVRGSQSKIFATSDVNTGFPVWSLDGTYLFFRSSSGTLRVRADGASKPETVPGSLRADYPAAVSPDGKMLIVTRILPETSGDLVALPIGGGESKVLQGTPAYEGGAQFSPDGKWLTYTSNRSGRMEVYLRPVDGPDTYAVSTAGGLGALWSRDGKRIFFRNGLQFLVVDVEWSPTVRLSAPRVLFERRYSFGPNLTIANYSMNADSTAFLLVSPGGGYLNLIFNWLHFDFAQGGRR